MAPTRKPHRREANLGALIEKLELLHEGLGGDEKKKEEEEALDEFTRLKKLAAKQVNEVRKLIQERDELLEASSGSGGKQSVELSSKIREILRQAKDSHKKMQTQLSQEEKDLAKGKVVLMTIVEIFVNSVDGKKKGNLTQEDIDAHTQMVELVGKHIVECENLEKRRYQSRVGGRGGTAALTAGATRTGAGGEIRRNIEAGDTLADIDPEIGEGLQQLKRNDQQLDAQLEQISKGLTRLKGIAQDQSNEIKLQSVMIDQISDNMDKATGHLNDVNHKLKETLDKAGGATNIIIKMILLILLLGVAAYLYKMFA
eukprot:CAMPEP_0113728010 /NCGR_PEP_ID=MMETSP0038_2-20120614/41591_1 /TAXON_ID=2898 /ORGANISM="Cryptomonas paramecium" /LENGTH=313 /DNA_ID=CAMNT_0000659363 /DNA_START=31 /DNA_END=972 /DNA_ORIENTATION=- /assembly_acc=CAM_ASM_000170